MRLAHFTPGPTRRRIDRTGAAQGSSPLGGTPPQSRAEPTPLRTITPEAASLPGYHHAPRGDQPESQAAPALEPSPTPAPQLAAPTAAIASPPTSDIPHP